MSDAALGFLLKRVQHIDPGREPHRINRPIGVAAVILDQFEHAGAAKTPERFRVGGRLAKLRGEQRDTESAAHGRRKFPQLPTARSDPDELFRLEFIRVGRLYIYMYNCQGAYLCG